MSGLTHEFGEVRFPQALWEQVYHTLLTERNLESKCFLLCHSLEMSDRVVFVVRELVPLSDHDYEERSPARVVTRPEFVHALLQRCAREGLALLEAHSHPWGGNARFSQIDHRSDRQKFQTTEVIPPPFRHGTLVFGSDMSFEGHLWDYTNREVVPIVRIKVVGDPYQIRYATNFAQPSLAQAQRAVYDRQVRAFGEPGQRMLSQLHVALVGTGGLGSQIALALTHLGVGHLTLIDPDPLEMSNLNRVVGALWFQAEARQYKVDALARHLRRVQAPSTGTVEALPIDVREPLALKTLLQADLMVGAVDSAAVRHYLNVVSAAGLIPYLDAGVGVRAEQGALREGGGQVQVVIPGETACLTCVGRSVRQSVEEQLTPHQRAMSVARGYIQGEAIPNPQVVFLNGVVANLLVWELVKLCTGCHPVEPYVYYNLLEQKVFPAHAPRNPDCYVCGDQSSLLGSGLTGIESYQRRANRPVGAPIPAPRSSTASNPAPPKRKRGKKRAKRKDS
ncbi:MAG: ThiF family adenylyltransferase [Fimbriimonadales bacterium]